MPSTITAPQNVFAAAVWAGLGAPVALFSTPQPYPYYLGTLSVPQSFAQVGSFLSYTLNNNRDDARGTRPTA
jgi:hypothetical protein